jgi:O-antigen biosynthesis protein
VVAGGSDDAPLVSVITVNHDGERYLPGLLDSLSRQTYRRFEVLVVDNASSDGSVGLVRSRYPWVRVIEAGGNLGFVGGNNLGFAAARGELFALINNDTVVEPDWLAHLVREAGAAPDVGAVASKILFARSYLPVRLAAPTFCPARLGTSSDSRELGVFLAETSGFVDCSYRKPIFRDGFFTAETVGGEAGRWSGGRATVDLPLERRDRPAALRLRLTGGAAARRAVEVQVGGAPPVTLEIAPEASEHLITVPLATVEQDSYEVINNAGSFLTAEGSAGDRGIFEPDRGQLDEAEEIGAFCGCSALLRRRALADAGVFDRDFFMYFEDTELSWRLRKAGYRLRYQPASVVRHFHAGSSGESSPLFVFLVARNRILMLLKQAPLRVAARAYLEELARAVRLVVQHRSLRAPSVRTRWRVQRSLLVRAPRALLKRWGVLGD